MRSISKLTIIFFYISTFYCCSGDDNPTATINDVNIDFEMFYSYRNIGGQEIQNSTEYRVIEWDTLSLRLGDIIILRINPNAASNEEDDVNEKVTHGSYIETVRLSTTEFQCTAVKRGTTPVSVHYGNAFHYLYMNVESFYKSYATFYAPSYVVETNDNALSSKIKDDIENHYISLFLRHINFNYNTLESGEFVVTTFSHEEVYFGTFSIKEDMLTLVYNGVTDVFKVTNTSDMYNSISLENDLTEYYQRENPGIGIDRVSVILNLIPVGR